MNVNFELYKVFYHVAKHLSFSQASNKLYISQSAVSQSIKMLEDKLNCRLFIRSTKQVQLTPEGEILFQHIEQAFNFIQTGERSIQEIHSLQRGEIRIGASDTICKYYLLPYLELFNQLYPQIKVRITNRTSPKCVELLAKGLVDISIINLPEEEKYHELTVKKLQTIHDVFIAGKNFTHLKGRTLELKELVEYPLLILEKNSTTRRFLDAFLEKIGLSLAPEIELGSVDLLIELAKMGMGIAFVSQEYISKELERGEIFLVKTKEEFPPRYLGLIKNNKLPLTLAAQKFADLLNHPTYT